VQHSTLVAMGVRWLSRQCSVVLYEFATEADENPDVIGWALGAGSVLIECKLSRSDFLSDATKTVRRNPCAGMGHRRYYLCPTDLIQVKDLPSKWGLLWATKGQVNRKARGAGTSGEKPRGRGAVPQFDAQARTNTNRYPAALGMAERRESLRGKTWHLAHPRSGNSENEPHTSLSKDPV
jgi:hypothetical protein